HASGAELIDCGLKGSGAIPDIRAQAQVNFLHPAARVRLDQVLLEQSRLLPALFALHVKIVESQRGSGPSARCPVQKSELDQIGLVDFLDRVGLFGYRGGNRAEAYRTAPVLLENREHDLLVNIVEAEAVHFKQVQGGLGHFAGDAAIGADLRVIAHAAEQAV